MSDLLERLPDELLGIIAEFTSLDTVKSLLITNKRIYNITINSTQFKIYNEFLKQFELSPYNCVRSTGLTLLRYSLRKPHQFSNEDIDNTFKFAARNGYLEIVKYLVAVGGGYYCWG